MHRIVELQPLADYRVWLRFDDGVNGVADLKHLAGKGVFAIWEHPGVFEAARIGDTGDLVWNDSVDLCPDALYMQITGKTPQDVFPNLKADSIHA